MVGLRMKSSYLNRGSRPLILSEPQAIQIFRIFLVLRLILGLVPQIPGTAVLDITEVDLFVRLRRIGRHADVTNRLFRTRGSLEPKIGKSPLLLSGILVSSIVRQIDIPDFVSLGCNLCLSKSLCVRRSDNNLLIVSSPLAAVCLAFRSPGCRSIFYRFLRAVVDVDTAFLIFLHQSIAVARHEFAERIHTVITVDRIAVSRGNLKWSDTILYYDR